MRDTCPMELAWWSVMPASVIPARMIEPTLPTPCGDDRCSRCDRCSAMPGERCPLADRPPAGSLLALAIEAGLMDAADPRVNYL